MKALIVLSLMSILFLIGTIFLGLMVLVGNVTPSIHMIVAFFGASISIASHAIFIGRYFKKN